MDLYAQDESSVPDSEEDFTFALLILTVVALGGRYASAHALGREDVCRHRDGNMPAFCRASQQLHRQSYMRHARDSAVNAVAGKSVPVPWAFKPGMDTHTASTVRVTQALELHKEDSEMRWTSPYYQSMDLVEKRQLKWRLFWAVHTSDRFLAMCYGLPPLISDEDCVVEIPREDCIYPPTGSPSFLMLDGENDSATGPNSTTLLTYQTHKLKFYVILGHIIQTLYRQTKGGIEGRCLTGIQEIVPVKNRPTGQPPRQDQGEERTPDDDDDIIDPVHDDACNDSSNVHERRKRIKNSIYGMQALLLQLAYDHALVLIHRPILTLKNNERQAPPKDMLCWSITYDVMKKEANRMFGEGSGELDNGYSYPEPLSRQQEDYTPTLQEPLPAAPTSNGSGAKNDMLDLSSIDDMQSNENRLLFDGLLPDTLLGLGSSMAEVDKLFWD
ncbi:hypothetical protein G4B84_011180, partial [Aspergillus flavus NRRL3357]